MTQPNFGASPKELDNRDKYKMDKTLQPLKDNKDLSTQNSTKNSKDKMA